MDNMKKIIIISVILFTLLFSLAFSGKKIPFEDNNEWNKTYGWREDGVATDIVKCKNGYIVVGYEMHYYNDGREDEDAHVTKIDEKGNVMWDKKWAGEEYTELENILKVDDGYIAVGYKGMYQMDFWAVKFNENGNIIWEKTYGIKDRDDFCVKIIKAKDKGYLLIGTTASLDWGKNNILLIKIDENGNEMWNRTYGKGRERADDIIATENGYIISGITGSFSKYNDWDVWIIKIDENGNEIWNRTYGWSDFETEAHVIETDDGYLVMGSTVYAPTQTGGGAFIIKIDKNGNEIWNKTYGGNDVDGFGDIAKIPGGDIIVGATESYNVGGFDIWLLKIDNEGNEIWNKSFGNRGDDNGCSVIYDNGYYVIAGRKGETKTNGTDAWIIKCADYPPPKIKIVKPKENYLYIFDREIMPFYKTMAIGKFTVIANVTSSYKNIKKVKFYLTWMGRKYEYEPREVLYSPPYEWEFNIPAISLNNPVEITVAAYYGNAGAVAVDKIEVYVINPFPAVSSAYLQI